MKNVPRFSSLPVPGAAGFEVDGSGESDDIFPVFHSFSFPVFRSFSISIRVHLTSVAEGGRFARFANVIFVRRLSGNEIIFSS